MSMQCKKCGARVFYALASNNARLIIDASPQPDGNFVLRKQVGDDGHEVFDGMMQALGVEQAAQLAHYMGDPLPQSESRFVLHEKRCQPRT